MSVQENIKNARIEFDKALEAFYQKHTVTLVDDEINDELRKLLCLGQELSGAAIHAEATVGVKETKICDTPFIIEKNFSGAKQGDLVRIQPCADEYKGKTYLGFYLGNIARYPDCSIAKEVITVDVGGHNPAIFIPELGKIIYGYESYWGKINSPDELKDITADEINNLWYVKALKEQLEKSVKDEVESV